MLIIMESLHYVMSVDVSFINIVAFYSSIRVESDSTIGTVIHYVDVYQKYLELSHACGM